VSEGQVGSPGDIATPETPVYGYKHRRRYPVLEKGAEGELSLKAKDESFVKLKGHAKAEKVESKTLAYLDAGFSHLVKGGADGATVVAKGEFVHPPEGPLPLDTKAVKA
jgi:hypothetical protein